MACFLQLSNKFRVIVFSDFLLYQTKLWELSSSFFSFFFFELSSFQVKAEEVTARVENLLEELRIMRNEVSVLRSQAATNKASAIISKAISIGTSNIR